MSVKKIGERTNILKQQAFTLCQIKPNQILPPEMQKTDQSILPAFLLCLKRNDPQTFKSGSCKKSFLQCVYYWYNLLRWMFFILCGKQKDYFLWKFIVTVILFRGHVATFFEANVLKEVRILCVISTISIWCL